MAQEPKMSKRLWSQEVALADARSGYVPPRKDWVYVFGNGKRFDDGQGPYEPLVKTSTG